MNNLKSLLKNSVYNIPGWHTKRKIVVIESDDWGSIRMPSKDVYNKLLSAGIQVDKCPFCTFDTLEDSNDLQNLFEVLSSVVDYRNNPAILTANAVVANPDFEKIKRDNFNKYHFKTILESYPNLELMKLTYSQGINNGCLKVQSHGREHLNVSRWMRYLREGYNETRFAFELGVFGISTTITSENRKSFMAAFDFDTEQEELEVNQIAKDALNMFNRIFGFSPKSFIFPNYTWSKSLENTISKNGVEYLQGSKTHAYTVLGNEKSPRRLRVTGRRPYYNLIDLSRNVEFEPSLNLNYDWIANSLKNIEIAFFWHKPAIISSHRLNFVGSLNTKNRDRSLALLKELLMKIKKIWPDVEFMSSDNLGDIIKYNE